MWRFFVQIDLQVTIQTKPMQKAPEAPWGVYALFVTRATDALPLIFHHLQAFGRYRAFPATAGYIRIVAKIP